MGEALGDVQGEKTDRVGARVVVDATAHGPERGLQLRQVGASSSSVPDGDGVAAGAAIPFAGASAVRGGPPAAALRILAVLDARMAPPPVRAFPTPRRNMAGWMLRRNNGRAAPCPWSSAASSPWPSLTGPGTVGCGHLRACSLKAHPRGASKMVDRARRTFLLSAAAAALAAARGGPGPRPSSSWSSTRRGSSSSRSSTTPSSPGCGSMCRTPTAC